MDESARGELTLYAVSLRAEREIFPNRFLTPLAMTWVFRLCVLCAANLRWPAPDVFTHQFDVIFCQKPLLISRHARLDTGRVLPLQHDNFDRVLLLFCTPDRAAILYHTVI